MTAKGDLAVGDLMSINYRNGSWAAEGSFVIFRNRLKADAGPYGLMGQEPKFGLSKIPLTFFRVRPT